MAAATGPAVVFVGRPAANRASNAGAGGVEALFLVEVAIQNHGRFGSVIREGVHARYYDLVRTHGVVNDCRLILSCSVRIGRVRISTLEAALLGRRMFKRELGVSRLFDLDHERHSSFRAAKRERLARVFVRDGVHVLEVAIRTALDHAASKLGLLIRVLEIDDRECDPRIASRVLRFE